MASLLGMAAITSIPSAGDKIIEEQSHAGEHSWRDMIGEQAGSGGDGQSREKGQGQQGGQQQQQAPKKAKKETEEQK